MVSSGPLDASARASDHWHEEWRSRVHWFGKASIHQVVKLASEWRAK